MNINFFQKFKKNKIVLATFSALVLAACSQASGASTSAARIGSDRGGEIITYAMRVAELKSADRDVRFSGACDSACTLHLSLPRSKTCVSAGASFGFHLPYGSSPKNNQVAANYLMRSYPGWVRSWIAARGGLSGNMKRMDFAYASQHLPVC